MSFTLADLNREIDAVVEGAVARRDAVLHPAWLTQAVMARHPDISGGDADFAVCAAQAYVRNEVRLRLNRYKLRPEEAAEKQMLLPGFERLQLYYLVSRGGEQVAVHVEQLTPEEGAAKLAELRAMREGLDVHIRELARFLAERHGLDRAA